MICLLIHFHAPDVSVAGKQEGIVRGVTRSGLLYECERIIEHCRPKYLLMENVKNLVGKKFKAQFDEWLAYLESLGYANYWKVLNAKDYGIPQNRERVFVVSILGEHMPYKFPNPIPLDKCIADILEEEVDEKYYINKPFHLVNKGYQAELDIKGMDCIKRAYATDNIAPALTTMQGGNRQPKIICEQRSDEGLRFFRNNICGTVRTKDNGENERVIEYKGEQITLPCIGASRGRNPKNPSSRTSGEPTEQRLEINTKGTSNTITTVQKDNYAIDTNYRIRKLTPRECFRLMGLNDDHIDKIQAAGISNTQQYKMAGNSIVVPVLEAIFRNLFIQQ